MNQYPRFLGQVPIAGLGQRIYHGEVAWVGKNLCTIAEAWDRCRSPRECAIYQGEFNRWYGRLHEIDWMVAELEEYISRYCPPALKAFNDMRAEARRVPTPSRPPPAPAPLPELEPVATPAVVDRPFEQPVYQPVELPALEPVPSIDVRRGETSFAPLRTSSFTPAQATPSLAPTACPTGFVRDMRTGECVPSPIATGYRPQFSLPGLPGLFAGAGGIAAPTLGIPVRNLGQALPSAEADVNRILCSKAQRYSQTGNADLLAQIASDLRLAHPSSPADQIARLERASRDCPTITPGIVAALRKQLFPQYAPGVTERMPFPTVRPIPVVTPTATPLETPLPPQEPVRAPVTTPSAGIQRAETLRTTLVPTAAPAAASVQECPTGFVRSMVTGLCEPSPIATAYRPRFQLPGLPGLIPTGGISAPTLGKGIRIANARR